MSLPANQLMEIVRQNTSTSVVSTVTSSASAIATEALSSRKHELNSRDRAVTETSIVSDTPSTAAPAPAIMPSKPPGHTILNTEASTGTHASVEGIDLLLTADQGRNTSKNTANITAPTTSINRRPIYRPQQPSYQRSLGRSYVPELGKDSSHFTHSSDRKVIFSTPVTLTPLVRRRFRVIHANMKPPVPLLEPDICDINASSFYTLPSSILSFGSLTRSKGLLYGNTPLISSGMTQNRMIPQLPPISSIRMPSPMYADKEHIGFVGLTPTYAAITTSSYGMNTINHNPLFGPSGPIYESQFSRSPNQSYPQQQLQQQQMQVQQQQQQHQPQAQLYSHEQYYNNN